MSTSPGLGRPREFELVEAAHDAMNVFWDRGYQAASLPDLIAGTGLSRGSLYKAFGDKNGLLLAALDVYVAEGLKATADILARPGSARDAIRESLLRYAALSSGESGRRGCFVVAMAAELGAHEPEVEQRIARMFRRLQQLYASAIIRGQASGDIRDGDELTAARFLVCQIQGMRVLGKTQVSAAEVTALVESTMGILD